MSFFDPDRLDRKKFQQRDGDQTQGEEPTGPERSETSADAGQNQQPEFPLPEWAQQKQDQETPQTSSDDRIDPETGQPISLSEGISFAPLIPFFILLIGLVLSGLVVIMAKSPPAKYDPSKYGPPAITLEECVSGFFHDAQNTTGTVTAKYFLSDFDVINMQLHKVSPFSRGAQHRYQQAVTLVTTGDFIRITPHPQEPPKEAGIHRLEYERKDLQTGVITEEVLWLGRAPDGWYIGGFE